MKKVKTVLRIFLCALFILGGLVFGAIQGFQILSGDWRLFENQGLALIQYLAKCLLALYCLGISLAAAIRYRQSCLWTGAQLLAITLASAPFVSNGLGWPFVGLAVLLLLTQLPARKPFPKA